VRDAATICPRPCKLTISSYLFARWRGSSSMLAISDINSKLTFDLLTLKVVPGSCDVGYLCAEFSLPWSLCCRRRPDIRDRQTSDTHHRFMPPPVRGGGVITRTIIRMQTSCRCVAQKDRLPTSLDTTKGCWRCWLGWL